MNHGKEKGFERAMGEAKRQASNVADAANTATHKTANSFEMAARSASDLGGYSAGYIDRSNRKQAGGTSSPAPSGPIAPIGS
jgi:hypothetical protein